MSCRGWVTPEMVADRIFEPAFPGLASPWTSALVVYSELDLRVDAAASEHARTVESVVDAQGLDGIAWARQVHGDTVLRVEDPGFAGEADALWTTVSGLGIMGRSADCPIVLIAGYRGDGLPIWGMAHASWRSTVAGITSRLLVDMVAADADPDRLWAMIAPSAGPCCYEVGEEVREEALTKIGPHATGFFDRHDDRLFFDLWAANSDALSRGGLTARIDGRCTICGDGFPSYRRDGEVAARFGVVVGFASGIDGGRMPRRKRSTPT